MAIFNSYVKLPEGTLSSRLFFLSGPRLFHGGTALRAQELSTRRGLEAEFERLGGGWVAIVAGDSLTQMGSMWVEKGADIAFLYAIGFCHFQSQITYTSALRLCCSVSLTSYSLNHFNESHWLRKTRVAPSHYRSNIRGKQAIWPLDLAMWLLQTHLGCRGATTTVGHGFIMFGENRWKFHGFWSYFKLIWLVVTGTMEWIMTFPSYWEFHHPNWVSYFSEGLVETTNQSLKVDHFSHELYLWPNNVYLLSIYPLVI